MLVRSFLAVCLLPFMALPLSAQEREWSFDQTDKDAYLVFGVPETDDVGMSFWCTQRSGSVSLFLPETDAKLKPNHKVKVSLEAGGKHFHFQGKATDNKEAANNSVEVTLLPDDKLFATLREQDRVKIAVGASVHTFPLQDVDFGTLLQLCAKP